MTEPAVDLRAAEDSQSFAWSTLVASLFVTFCGYYAWVYTFHNFAIEELGSGPQEIGITRSLVSIPGILAFAIGGLLFAFTAARTFVASFLLLGVGLIVVGVSSNWMVAAAGAVSISFGQVILYTITNKIGIFRGPPRQTTLFLGRLKSYGPLASLVVTIGIFFVVGGLGLRSLLVGVGVAVIAFGIWIANSLTGVTLGLTAPSLRFRRELLTYYAMNFVAGFRSQIFRTYVFILLITEYAFPVERIAAIHLAGTVCGLAGYRLMGHLASRLGGPTTLSIVYLIVALLFIGFATIANAKVLAVLFLLDSLLFSTSVITDAHLRARSQPEYVFSDLGTGITLFHVAGFVAPLLGGLTMGLFGYEGAFYLGAAVALLGVILSRYLR
jgi:hypothetical protein